MLPLDEYLRLRRSEVETALLRYLPARSDAPAIVLEAMRYSLTAGGKRFRPILVLAAAEAVATHKGDDVAASLALAMPVACAIEMIHTYSLIHDDLPAMDDDVMRRGRPTLHVVVGDGMAILAGDGLHAEAFGLIAHEPKTTDPAVIARKLRVSSIVADAAGPRGMVGGQAIDLEAVRPGPDGTRVALDADAVQNMHARKTGALIRACAVTGAVMAGATETQIAALDRYAADIGLAFQIVDDVLDVEAESSVLGKTAGKDSAAGKPTYPALFGLARSKQLAAECLTRAEAALADAGVADSQLTGIARWIVARRS